MHTKQEFLVPVVSCCQTGDAQLYTVSQKRLPFYFLTFKSNMSQF